ncbi:hypothetical protein ACFC0X_12670 [Paenibacillus chitinolyticus]|uniref:hypothetical protein n=1 Tax=Paenibacillus chitinolyticus TaxID=79263 RepID=UPI0035DEE158
MSRRRSRNAQSAEALQRIRETNEAIIQNIDSILPRYNSQFEEVQDIIEFNVSIDASLNVIPQIPLKIPNPLEDSIRYRYIICVEFFKAVARAVRDSFFQGSYSEMNRLLLQDKPIKDYISTSLDKRNTLAHIFVSNYLDTNELDFDVMINNLEGLKSILEVYVVFVRVQNNPNGQK